MESDRKLTLPPAVCGNINGTLKIRVDEIYWADRRPKDSYFVRLKWWGSQNHHIFYPEDVSKNFRTDNYQEGVNDVVFNVCTSAGLFEAYLKKCHRLKFHLLTDKGLLLGTAVVGDMDRILALEPYPSYYPVVDKTGKRIADLHIYFELSFLDEREPDSEDELECVSDENLKQNFKLRKETVRRLKQGDEIINSVVVKGQELRKAMVNSVLAPCDMETVEQVIDFKNALTLCDVSRTKSEDAKLMDYLMGKEMTKEEEEEAIKLLHCKSPVFGRSLQERSSTVYTRDFKTCDVEDDEVLACGAYSKIKHKNPLSASVIALIKTNALISINSYRVGLSNLILTSNGLRKIFNTPDYIATHLTGKVPSETQFIFEYHPVMNLGKSWHRPYVLISKSFEGNVVKFNEYAISKLKPGPNPWERIESLIAGSQIKVYWKHSNQKMPSLLGTTSYPSALHAENFSKKIVIPLYTRYKLHVGNLQLRIELGLGMIYGDAIDKYRKDIYSKAHKGFNTKETYKDLCSNKTDLQGDAEEVLEEAKITFCPMSEDEEEKNKQLMVLSKQAVSYMEKTEQKNTKVPLRDAIASLAGKLQENLMAKKFFQTNDNLSQPDKHEDFCQDPSVTKNMDENDRNMADDLSRMTNKTESSDNDNSNELLESLSNINPGCCEYCCCTQKYCQANNKGGKSIQIKKQWETRSKTCSCGNRQALLKESDCKQNLCNEPVLKRKPRVQATKCRQEVEGISKLPECGFTKCKSSQSFSRQNDSQMMVETAESLPAFGTSTSREKPIITSHMYKIDVYSCDAHFFYQKGELEFYLTYDFPVINKKTGKVKFPQKPTCIELDGEPYPQEHCLFTITSLTDQLISLPRDHITFQIWARCFKKQQEHLVAQARFPLKKLVEWEASYIFAHSNSFNPKLKETSDKYFTPLRLFQEPSNLSIGFDIWNLKNLTLEFDYERFCGSWPELLSLKGFDQELYNENSNPGRFFFNSEISELQLGERDESNLKLPAGKQDIGNDTENQLRFVEKERAYISPQLTEEKYRKNDWRNEFREPVITSDPVTGGPKSERFLFEKDQKQLQDDYCSQKPLPHHSLSKDEDHWASKSLEEKHFFEEETNKISDFKPASIPPSFLGDSTLSSLPPDVVFVDIMSEKLSEGNNPFESPKKLKDKKHWKYIESTDLDFISTVDQTVENPNVYPNYANRKTDKNAENLIPVKHKSDIHFYKNHDSHFLDQPRNLIKKQEKHPHILSNKEEDKNVIGQENIKGKSIQQKSGLLNDTWPGHKKKKNVIDEACTPSTGYIIDSGLSEDVIDLSTPPKQIVNIDTQTTDSNWSLLQMEPFKIPKYFSARVDIGGAINLPSVNSLFKTSQTSNDKLTSYVTFNARVKGEDVVLNTPVICDDLNPVYNTGWKVELPSGMLYKADNELEFNVVLQITDQKQILKATVDLTTLSAGLAYIDGWYFLFNGSRSQGQLKVNVTPLEDIGTFREVWTQEIVRKKEEARHCPTRCGAFSKELLNDQHYAKSLQEKMEELDRLTEKMKKKIENIDSWSDSPPINLLKEVNAAAKRLCTDDELPLRTNKEKKKTCKTSLHLNLSPASSSKSDSTPLRSPIPLIDLTSSPESDATLGKRVLSIADSDGRVNLSESRNSPSKNVMQVETLFEAVPKDSLEAASNSIEKIIQDLRKARLNE
ncbi:uncharacterized protein LOC106672368 isoform X6 [Cimex lectularius]|uniref:C2 domain-containing protein n=1 Tax=Cimex lectularius TaxID=79782 RepID=A0A8I6S9C8_CIMLE|nr:uncharacterized protein LOC106672368 isoform X6 [Cimex lectularius]